MKRTDLTECLDLVKPALATSDLVPMFTNLCFSQDKVRAYNDNLGIISKLPEAVSTDKGFGIHGKTLIELLKNSRAPDVTFNFEGEEVLIKAGRSKIKLPFIDEDEFLFAEVDPSSKWTAQIPINEELLRGIDNCLLTSSRDNSMPAIMGITISKGDESFLYSCDSDAISRFSLDGVVEITSGKKSFKSTIPNEFCDALLKITGKTKDTTGEIKINDDWAIAELDSGYTIYGRIMSKDNTFDHAKMIEKSMTNDPTFIPIPKGLLEALLRAQVVAASASSPTKATVGAGKLVLATTSHVGAVRDVFKLKSKHPEVEAMLYAKAAHQCLTICKELALMENITAYRDDGMFIILSNLGQD